MNSEKISREEIIHIAQLAKLGLTEEEITKFQLQLSSILEYVSQLNEVDTSHVEPTHQVSGLTNVMRDDAAEPSLSPEEALKNAPEQKNGFIVVRRVLE